MFENLKLFNDDLEIIDILNEIPKIPIKPFNNRSILQYIQDESYGKDFGMVMPYKRIFYIIYKCGSETDSGLILIMCDFENVNQLLFFMESDNETLFPDFDINTSIKNDIISFSNYFNLFN